MSLDDIEVDTVENDESGVDIDDIVYNEEGLQKVNNNVETFNFDPLMSYNAMLQEAEEAGANNRQPWKTNM